MAAVVVVAQHLWPSPAGHLAHLVVQLLGSFLLPAWATRRWRDERSGSMALVSVYAWITAVCSVAWPLTGQINGPLGAGNPWDIVFLAALPLGVVGLGVLCFSGLNRTSWLRLASDAFVVASAMLFTGWLTWFAVPRQTGQLDGLRIASLLPSFGYVAALGVLAAVMASRHAKRGLGWVAAAAGSALVCDTAAVLDMGPTDQPHLLVLLSWALTPYMLLGAVMTVGSQEPSGNRRPGRRRAHVFGSILLNVVAIVGLLVRGGSLDDTVVITLLLLLGIAVVVNQLAVSAEIDGLLFLNEEHLERLRASEARFRTAFDGAPVGIAILEDGLFSDVNPALEQIVGRSRRELVGSPYRDLVSEETLPPAIESDWNLLTDETSTRSAEVPLEHPDGTTTWCRVTVARSEETPAPRFIAIVEDTTERRAARERLAHLAVFDQLTGLPNRRTFVERLNEALESPEGAGVAVGFLDLDRFKVVNDSLGHAVGDRVLVVLAERIREALGDRGLVARFAGDEFTLLLPDCDRSRARTLLDEVRAALAQPVPVGDGVLHHPTASIGVCWLPAGEGDSETALARADAAMYRAKAKGRNQIDFYDAASDDAEAHLRVVSDLHRALERQELRAHYQPIVDLASGRTVGFEALVRWQHPRHGLLAPAAFIDAAEESGLIVEVGGWMLAEAVGQLRTWRSRFPHESLTISVNVAARQLTEPFVDQVRGVLERTGVDPRSVWLEITETALMVDVRQAESVLAGLHRLGVHLTVDDFGTGYSSLTYLSRFPVDGLKIDRSFTEGAGIDAQADAICEGVTSLANALGLRTVAEGIELPEQWARLRSFGCRCGQGYLFGRPVPAEQAVRHIGRVAGAEEAVLTPGRAR